MKKCDKCGYENRDAAKFCNDCGAPLTKRSGSTPPVVCPSCGAVATQGARFCGACGTELAQGKPLVCAKCGYSNDSDARFCIKCGNAFAAVPVAAQSTVESDEPVEPDEAPVASTAESERAQSVEASTRSSGTPLNKAKSAVACAKGKTVEFEKKHNIIVNAIVIVLATVIFFVSLFAPIKLRLNANSLSAFDMQFPDNYLSSTYDPYDDDEYININQPFWKVLGALGYVGLDPVDDDDLDKIEDILSELEDCMDAANGELREWRTDHPYASDKRIQEERIDIMEDHLSDINFFACLLAATTDGLVESEIGSLGDVTRMIVCMMKAARASTVVSLIEGVVMVALSLITAVASLAFIVLAISGMVQKRTRVGLFKYLMAMLALSGAGVIIAMASTLICVGGGALGLTIFACVMHFIASLADAVLNGKSLLQILKRAAICAVMIVAFFVLCGEVLKVTSATRAGSAKTEERVAGSVGALISELISSIMLVKYGPYTRVELLGPSVAASVLGIVFGILLPVVMLIALLKSFRDLRVCPNDSIMPAVLVSSVVLALLLAILPAAIGSAAVLPTASGADDTALWIKLSVKALAPVYVSLAFAAVGVVLSLCFRPKKAQAEAVAAA